MIALSSDCLLFQLANGETVPCSADMISVEIAEGAEGLLDPDLLRHAASSVFHYFRVELEREAVTVTEFSLALEKVLGHLGYPSEAGDSLELFFFARLRAELHTQLRQSPRLIRFRGLRGCVKQIAGVRRWSPRCEDLQDQIVAFLRQCMTSENDKSDCALVVE